MPLEIGSTFIHKHLWIIISYPFNLPEKIIAVNLTTLRNTAIELNDTSCIANIGDHRFIKEKSYIYYHKAIRPCINDLQKAINQGLIVLDEKCSDNFLDRILKGAAESPFIPIWATYTLQQQKLI